MAFNSNFIISTTSSLEGYDIQEYLGTVSSHVVTGTGFFSDFAASFTDIFGGRSVSYQKQLISIKDEVLDRLKHEALDLGANCILGLKIDFDEISGKGKTMFMVTALGTAVDVRRIKKNSNEEFAKVKLLKSEKIESELLKKKIVRQAEELKLDLKAKDVWEAIIDNNIYAVVPYLNKYIIRKFKNIDEANVNYPDNDLEVNVKLFYSQLPENVAKEHIYNLLMEGTKSARQYAANIIKENQLLDYDKITMLLNSEKHYLKKRALGLLYYNKPFYSSEDLSKIGELIDIINNAFPIIGEKFEKKQMLSSKTVEMWKCKCGKEMSVTEQYCSSCGDNIYGFSSNEIHPKHTKEYLKEKLDVLKELLE